MISPERRELQRRYGAAKKFLEDEEEDWGYLVGIIVINDLNDT